MSDGLLLKTLAEEIDVTIAAAMRNPDLEVYAQKLRSKLDDTKVVLDHLASLGKSSNFESYIADASIFLEYFSLLVIGWQWLKIAVVVKEEPSKEGENQKHYFQENQFNAMRFYFKYELSKMSGLKEVLLTTDLLTVSRSQEAESMAHEK